MQIIAFVLGVFVSSIVVGQDVTGQLNGVLMVHGTHLRMVFNISKAEDGFTSTMDSPDQQVKGIPLASTSFENEALKLAIAIELPNLNHLFQECKTGSPAEYATSEQTFSPTALN
jgi:hypothetical protein